MYNPCTVPKYAKGIPHVKANVMWDESPKHTDGRYRPGPLDKVVYC